ncbi:hypothetical protein FACS189450_13720 [Spirochaetia bacterium]|nr:hypothetical protein FACS189450_13720 [Spirochaetia bacterium]
MDKRDFIKYHSAYGGQSYKQNNKRKAFSEIINFLEKHTIYKMPENIMMKIYETPDIENDSILIKNFEEIFGIGSRILWSKNNESGNELYCWEWKLKFDDIEKCLMWFEKQKQFSKYFMHPTLIINFDFQWKNKETGDLMSYQDGKYFDNDYNSKSHLLIMFSKTNTIILDFNFPFENITKEFIALKEEILKYLPIELKDNNFRILKLCKDGKTYKQNKIKI